MVKEHLLHNMRTRQIPTAYINLIKNMLSNHKTQFRFDDYTSGPIELNNRIIQGCPLSMLIYTSYNADLINIAKGKCKLSTRFVDDYIFVATGNNIQDTHQTLKNMMERVEGSLDWLHNHNSPFRLSKFACMDFLRPNTPLQPAVNHHHLACKWYYIRKHSLNHLSLQIPWSHTTVAPLINQPLNNL